MARVNTVGIDELADDIRKEAGTSRERIEKMIDRGAEIMTEAIREKAEAHGLRNTGKLIESIKPGPVQIYSDSASVDIWPQGTRKNGRKRGRNATVGFVQNYGRHYKHKYRPGTKFFDEAQADAADAVVEGMTKIWNKEGV